MFFDFLNHLINLDLGWFIWLFTANIFWLFAFGVLCFFFWEGHIKKTILAVVLISIVAWTWVDFELMSGWVLFVGGFLSVYYITKLVLLVFVEDMPAFKDKLIIISELQFIVLLVAYNMFMR